MKTKLRIPSVKAIQDRHFRRELHNATQREATRNTNRMQIERLNDRFDKLSPAMKAFVHGGMSKLYPGLNK